MASLVLTDSSQLTSDSQHLVCHLLGDYLESIKRDFEKAGKMYKTNCDELNFPRSCYKFGNYLVLGKGRQEESHIGAFDYFKKGCDLGDADACLNAGLMKVSSSPAVKMDKDHAQGLALLEKGCEKDHAFCCYYISGIFISGIKDTPIQKDMDKAFKYSTKACELGSIHACANLSQMYSRGDGTPKNPELAERFKKKAIEMQDGLLKPSPTLTFQEGVKPV
uniref:Cytochrome c oxidase assembly factor 7 n=1 Tax=Timema poppense TaxID=170557 RepID=A0A7R9H2F7_TIMPO|nr:unnamed protein product [Timema poppensis]